MMRVGSLIATGVTITQGSVIVGFLTNEAVSLVSRVVMSRLPFLVLH